MIVFRSATHIHRGISILLYNNSVAMLWLRVMLPVCSIHTYTVLYSNICVPIILIFKSKMIDAMQCHSVVVMVK